ncbi:PmoA family protein [Paenibacillus nasutitermitis]|uniref:Methane oxygenase PmoA n=1 Tax=Paenibacillus nasutitermitis TaxID=1652958 RepID=A0A917DZW3_9BACL|nr:PmoA family protein [Paenibacillus nasutitermitis]GGD83380.1 hypothetical protein GCM10010911_46930 [Paenibacillus nasutitermitis]
MSNSLKGDSPLSDSIQPTGLRAVSSAYEIRIYRQDGSSPILVQQAEAGKRPFIHPIAAPDGAGILTEDAPPHHPWQHGLYVGLNDVNGSGFWKEKLGGNREHDGTFHPRLLEEAAVEGSRASWTVTTDWRDRSGQPLLVEQQCWTLHDLGDRYELDMEWTLRAETDITFGQYAYGGLFLRMPYREETGGSALNSEGLNAAEAEGKRARWVAVQMPIAGRLNDAGIAFMDHPGNVEHPVPWRVDHQLGISPSCCIAGDWHLKRGESRTFRFRVYVFCGDISIPAIEDSWNHYTGGMGS